MYPGPWLALSTGCFKASYPMYLTTALSLFISSSTLRTLTTAMQAPVSGRARPCRIPAGAYPAVAALSPETRQPRLVPGRDWNHFIALRLHRSRIRMHWLRLAHLVGRNQHQLAALELTQVRGGPHIHARVVEFHRREEGLALEFAQGVQQSRGIGRRLGLRHRLGVQ